MHKEGKKESLARLNALQKIYLRLLYLLAACLRLFGARCIRCLACGAGFLYWQFARKRREAAIKSIMLHLGEPEAAATKIARASIMSNAQSFLEILFTKSFPLENNPRLRLNAVFRQMMQEDRPVVAITGHLGAWELMAGCLGSFRPRLPALVVVRNQKSPVFNAFMHDMRSPGNSSSIGHRNAAAVVLNVLRAGGTAAFLADHNTLRKEAVFLPFLGETAAVNIGPALLALRGKAIVYPLCLIRGKSGNYEFMNSEPLDTTTLQGSISERAGQIALFYTRALEEFIKACPEQWLWAHKRWKTRPPE